MLSEKQFRERAKTELRQIGEQLLSLATDRDVYRRFERDIAANNPQLQAARSEFIDMLRGSYAVSMTTRISALLDCERDPCLAEVLKALAQHQQILQDKLTEREFSEDRAALQQAFVRLRRAMSPYSAHHERTMPALAALHREVDAALDLMIETVKTYYWVVAGGYLELEVKYSGDPMSIFEFAWAVPILAS